MFSILLFWRFSLLRPFFIGSMIFGRTLTAVSLLNNQFSGYWRSKSKVFDFAITIICALPIIFKFIIKREVTDRLQGSAVVDAYNKCPLIEEDGILIDMTKECFTFKLH